LIGFINGQSDKVNILFEIVYLCTFEKKPPNPQRGSLLKFNIKCPLWGLGASKKWQ
jgi:hypothetical protein